MRTSIIISAFLLTLPLVGLRSQPSVSRQAESFFTEAVKLIDAGEYDRAWDLLVRAEEQFPELSAWKFEMGYIRMVQGKYDDAVSVTPGESDTSFSITVSFWKDATNLYATDSGLMAPFPFFFEKTAILPAIGIARTSEKEPTISELHDFRVDFIRNWYGEKNREVAEFFDVTLFDYHRRLIDAGHFMAYNVLIFYNEGNQEEVKAWMEENPNGINRLAAWIEKNPWPATENPFSRLSLEMMPTIPFGADDAELEDKYELMMPSFEQEEE